MLPSQIFLRSEDSTTALGKTFHILVLAKMKFPEKCVVLNLTEENGILFAAAAHLVLRAKKERSGKYERRGRLLLW